MLPMAAIKTATMVSAELLGIQNELGSIETNKIADIIGVEGNPINDIGLMQKVVFVMKEGKIYKSPN